MIQSLSCSSLEFPMGGLRLLEAIVMLIEIPKTSVKEPAARKTGVLETAGLGVRVVTE